MLILREALHGKTHFDEFERGLGVATNVLSSRLKLLLGNDLLERRRSAGPGSRLTYHLTEKGRAFFPVYVALNRLLKYRQRTSARRLAESLI
nr:winged helix-turn-helix transcriptional regulator [Cupriavidus sp.]